MPSSSARVDPGKLGHPVALTRGSEDGTVSESANGSTVQTTSGVSFATGEAQDANEPSAQDKASSATGGLFSVLDFARPAEERDEEVISPSESVPGATTGGGKESTV